MGDCGQKSNRFIHAKIIYLQSMYLRAWFELNICFDSSSQKAQRHPENKSVLILGAGYVSLPVVEYLSKSKNTDVTVGE